MKIRIAESQDYIKIIDFYYQLTDEMEHAQFKPGWEKDVYPTQEFLMVSIKNQELFVCEKGEELISCMIVNHEYNDGYRNIKWSIDVEDSRLWVIHALGVRLSHTGRGIAKMMVQKVINLAKEAKMQAIRLDVLEGNLPAESVYVKAGFSYVDTIRMYYEDTGWTNFKVYEYLISQNQ